MLFIPNLVHILNPNGLRMFLEVSDLERFQIYRSVNLNLSRHVLLFLLFDKLLVYQAQYNNNQHLNVHSILSIFH